MSTTLTNLRRTLATIARGLTQPRLYLLLLLSLATWSLAYQYKTTYTIDVGGLHDDAFVFGFNAKERNASLDYRWSGPKSSIRLPGIGNEPVLVTITTVGNRPPGEPPPAIVIEARRRSYTVQTTTGPHSDSFNFERGDPTDGSFELSITSPVFSPPGDPRRLGVIVDKLSVAPGDPGLRPFVYPPPDTLGFMLLGLVFCFLAVLVATGNSRLALFASYLLALAATALVIFARPELGLLAPNLPTVSAWGLALALIAGVVLAGAEDPALAARNRWPGASPVSLVHRLGVLAFGAAFVLRFGGLIYPQFLTSDIMLHVHNIQRVFNGQWVFPGFLPDGTPVPYPPALYVLLAPLAWFLGSSDDTLGFLLKWSAALLDAATCLGLAWAGLRLWSGAVGGIAALVYALSPAPFDLFSAGNYSNLFAQSAFNLTLLCAAVYLGGSADDGRWTMDDGGEDSGLVAPHHTASIVHRPAFLLAAITLGFFLTILGHYGMLLAVLGVMGLFALWAVVAGRRTGNSRAWALLGSFAVSFLGSFAVYYWRFLTEMWGQLSSALNRASGARTGSSGGQRLDAGVVLRKLSEKVVLLTGIPVLVTGLLGALLARGIGPAARALLLCWLAAAALFALLDQTLGDAIRWYYLGAAVLALLVGRFLGLLLGRGPAARWLVALSLLVMLAHLLDFWVGDLIFTRYH
ncbi:MAG: hypothetical protein ACJ78Q_10475 [Chloroflexia bacterium]